MVSVGNVRSTVSGRAGAEHVGPRHGRGDIAVRQNTARPMTLSRRAMTEPSGAPPPSSAVLPLPRKNAMDVGPNSSMYCFHLSVISEMASSQVIRSNSPAHVRRRDAWDIADAQSCIRAQAARAPWGRCGRIPGRPRNGPPWCGRPARREHGHPDSSPGRIGSGRHRRRFASRGLPFAVRLFPGSGFGGCSLPARLSPSAPPHP